MRTVFFLLLRLICYPALAILVAAGLALFIVKVNGQCPPLTEIGVTCVTKLSQQLADFGLAIGVFTLETGVPIVRVRRRARDRAVARLGRRRPR